MSENGDTPRAVLYARVSTDEQVRGYSLRQQLAALRSWCEAEGYRIFEEVEDPGHSGAYLERPGLDRVRDLVESGNVSVVVAQDADRITREPMHRAFLDSEMERHGCRLIALDDWGDDSHEGELLKYLKGWVSKGERLKIAERTRRGLDRRVAEGKVIGGNRSPYGFVYNEDRTALVPSEPEMGVVRRMFRMVAAEGESLGEISRRFKREGVPSAMGGDWPRSTVRYMLLSDLYLPRPPAELRGLVPEHLLAGLREDGSYGMWWWNRRKQTRWRERAEDGEIRRRSKTEQRPREQWRGVPVDLSGSGLVRAHVEAVREQVGKNTRRPPSTVAERFWVLSGGIARCAECGGGFSPMTVNPRQPSRRTYYRCHRHRDRPEACHNPRAVSAEPLEESVWQAVRSLFEEPERLMRLYEAYLERRRALLRVNPNGNPDAEARRLAQRLAELEEERRGYLRQNARGLLVDAELDVMLAEVDAQREDARRALGKAHEMQTALHRLEGEREAMFGRFAAMARMDLRNLAAEQRRKVLLALRARVEIAADASVRVRGVFDADITELLPMKDAPADESYTARFRREIPEPYKGVVSLDNTRRFIS